MLAEAQITPAVFTVPAEVTESIEPYEKAHSVDRDKLLGLALQALDGRSDQFGEVYGQLIDDPETFTWPVEDPLLCVAIAFMQEYLPQVGTQGVRKARAL
jgi:hypothetical protein